MDYKYRLRIQQIVDETGALKFVAFYNTNIIPHVQDQICVFIPDEQGNTDKRLYFEVKHIVHLAIMGDKDELNHIDDNAIDLQVVLLEDENL